MQRTLTGKEIATLIGVEPHFYVEFPAPYWGPEPIYVQALLTSEEQRGVPEETRKVTAEEGYGFISGDVWMDEENLIVYFYVGKIADGRDVAIVIRGHMMSDSRCLVTHINGGTSPIVVMDRLIFRP